MQKSSFILYMIYTLFSGFWAYIVYWLFFLMPVFLEASHSEILFKLYFIPFIFLYYVFELFFPRKKIRFFADIFKPILVFIILLFIKGLIMIGPGWFNVLFFIFISSLVVIDWKSPIGQYEKYLFIVFLCCMPTSYPQVFFDYDKEKVEIVDSVRPWIDSINKLLFIKNPTPYSDWRHWQNYFYNTHYVKDLVTNMSYKLNLLTIVMDFVVFALVLFFKKRTARRLYKETTVESDSLKTLDR